MNIFSQKLLFCLGQVLIYFTHYFAFPVPFAIEETSGIVSVIEPLEDYNRQDYQFETVVTDGHASLVTNLSVHVAPVARPTEMSEIVLQMSVQVISDLIL